MKTVRSNYVKRYASLVESSAIDSTPTNSHAWLNRAAALTKWAAMNPGTSLAFTCKCQARVAIVRSRVS